MFHYGLVIYQIQGLSRIKQRRFLDFLRYAA